MTLSSGLDGVQPHPAVWRPQHPAAATANSSYAFPGLAYPPPSPSNDHPPPDTKDLISAALLNTVLPIWNSKPAAAVSSVDPREMEFLSASAGYGGPTGASRPMLGETQSTNGQEMVLAQLGALLQSMQDNGGYNNNFNNANSILDASAFQQLQQQQLMSFNGSDG